MRSFCVSINASDECARGTAGLSYVDAYTPSKLPLMIPRAIGSDRVRDSPTKSAGSLSRINLLPITVKNVYSKKNDHNETEDTAYVLTRVTGSSPYEDTIKRTEINSGCARKRRSLVDQAASGIIVRHTATGFTSTEGAISRPIPSK